MRIVHLSQERVISFIFFLDFLLSPLLNTVTHVRLEPEAERYHRVSNAAVRQILSSEHTAVTAGLPVSSERPAEVQVKWKVLGVKVEFVFLQPHSGLDIDEE